MKIFGCEGSGEISSSSIIYSGSCWITSIMVNTNGSNDATVLLYNNTSAAGSIVVEIKVAAAENYGGRIWKFPRKCNNGIYAAITGTGASCIVEYIPYV